MIIVSIILIILGALLFTHIETATVGNPPYTVSLPTFPYIVSGAILISIGVLLLVVSIGIWLWKLGKE